MDSVHIPLTVAAYSAQAPIEGAGGEEGGLRGRRAYGQAALLALPVSHRHLLQIPSWHALRRHPYIL